MAFVVEDGTGLADATSYASVAEADAYFSDSGVATWTGIDAVKQQALVRGTRALDGMYASAWPGRKVRGDQGLEWPRIDAVDMSGYTLDEVPRAVKAATIEAALVELLTPGALSPSLDRGGAIIREKVGPIETEYASNAPADTVYATIRQALASIVPAGGGSVRLVRG